MSEFQAGVLDDGVRFAHDVTLIIKTVECASQINAVLGNDRWRRIAAGFVYLFGVAIQRLNGLDFYGL